MTTTAITREQGEGLSLRPKEVLTIATEQAEVLMDMVEKRRLYAIIGDKKYLEAEAWGTILAFNRVHPIMAWKRPIHEADRIVAWEARMELYRDGQLVGAGEMTCGLDEFPCQGKEGWGAHKAAMSAAQTWAMSKAARLAFSYVAVLAGFQPTPAEEMAGTDAMPNVRDEGHGTCPIHGVPFFKRGRMKQPAHPVEGGGWCNRPEASKSPKQAPVSPEPRVDTETGEISTGEAPGGQIQGDAGRDPATIKSLGALFQACLEDFGLARPAVVRLAGYSRQEDISDPAQVYAQVRSAKS